MLIDIDIDTFQGGILLIFVSSYVLILSESSTRLVYKPALSKSWRDPCFPAISILDAPFIALLFRNRF